jgi:hypothetical protein
MSEEQAKQPTMVRITFEDGTKMVIRRAVIDAVKENSDGTSDVYFNGHTVHAKNPMKELLAFFGFGEHVV